MTKLEIIEQELNDVLDMIDKQIDVIAAEAKRIHVRPLEMRTVNGDWILSEILVVKANVLTVLAKIAMSK